MKLKFLFLSILLVFGIGYFAHAQTIEQLQHFVADIHVNTDSSISVEEKITYDSGGQSKHGIFRVLRAKSAQDQRMAIDNISVVDERGNTYQTDVSKNFLGDVTIRIGDPEQTFVGTKIYIIRYVAHNAISYFADYDELYWNVTGGDWQFPINDLAVTVHLPDNADALRSACYYGAEGSTDRCTLSPHGTSFSSTRSLASGEGLTVAVGFQRGIVVRPVLSIPQKIAHFVGLFWPLFIPVIVFVVLFRRWYKKGRDEKGTGVIVPEYDVVDGLTPLEAQTVLHQNISGKGIISEILYLATKGYITITQTGEKKMLGSSVDYTLTLVKVPQDSALTEFDNQLLHEIFDLGLTRELKLGKKIELSNQYSLFGIISSLGDKVKRRLVERGYYTPDFISTKKIWMTRAIFKWIFAIAIILIFYFTSSVNAFGDFVFFLFFSHGTVTVISAVVAAVITPAIMLIFAILMPAKTKKGALAREHLLGLREYIDTAEKERIAFHNDPSKNAAVFETLLPYAIMFGLEKKWAKAFEGITLPRPSWYDSHDPFTPVVFTNALGHSFSSTFFNLPAGSGGSGGGGFSGGGGGGGGGGSW